MHTIVRDYLVIDLSAPLLAVSVALEVQIGGHSHLPSLCWIYFATQIVRFESRPGVIRSSENHKFVALQD